MSQLKNKYQTDQFFKLQMDEAEANYRLNLQRSLYSTIPQKIMNMVKFAGKDQQGHSVYVVIYQQFMEQKDVDKFYLHFINILDDSVEKQKRFNLIFFNTFCMTPKGYMQFRGIIRSLPLRYFYNLKHLIVFHPNFLIKALDWIVLGTINNYLKQRTNYANDIQQLLNFKIKPHNQFLSAIKQILKNDQHNQQISNNKNKKSLKTSHSDPSKRKLQSYQLSDMGMPLLLNLLVEYLKKNEQYLFYEGIFRKTISIDDQNYAVNQLFNQKYNYIQAIKDPYLIAVLIKRFLNNLVQPIIPYNQYNQILKLTQKNQVNKVAQIKQILIKINKLNYICLMYIIVFMVQNIIPKCKSNLMNKYNIAVILLPCLFRSKQGGIEDLMNSKKLVPMIQLILQNCEQIFGDKTEQNKYYSNMNKQSQKRYEESYMKGGKKLNLFSNNQNKQLNNPKNIK